MPQVRNRVGAVNRSELALTPSFARRDAPGRFRWPLICRGAAALPMKNASNYPPPSHCLPPRWSIPLLSCRFADRGPARGRGQSSDHRRSVLRTGSAPGGPTVGASHRGLVRPCSKPWRAPGKHNGRFGMAGPGSTTWVGGRRWRCADGRGPQGKVPEERSEPAANRPARGAGGTVGSGPASRALPANSRPSVPAASGKAAIGDRGTTQTLHQYHERGELLPSTAVCEGRGQRVSIECGGQTRVIAPLYSASLAKTVPAIERDHVPPRLNCIHLFFGLVQASRTLVARRGEGCRESLKAVPRARKS